MSLIAILITAILEYFGYLQILRRYFNEYLKLYAKLFINYEFINQRQIRYAYLFGCIPIIVILTLINIIVGHFILLTLLLNIFIVILCVQVFSWKHEALNFNYKNKNFEFIHTFAITFFAPLFWYLVFPMGIGVLCYLIIMMISIELKNKGLDLVVYNVIVDKMLFYANVVPYCILFIFLAIMSDFENVMHYILEERKNFIKSFYWLDELLHDVVVLAVKKGDNEIWADNFDRAESGDVSHDHYDPQIITHIIALLYRVGIFFIGVIALLWLSRIVNLVI